MLKSNVSHWISVSLPTHLTRLTFAVVIGSFASMALLLWLAAIAPSVQAAPPARPLAAPTPVLTITKSSTHPTPLSPGDTITYTIVVSNSGDANATNALISDTLPADTYFVVDSIILNPSGAGITGTVPPTLAYQVTITVGQSVTLTYQVTVTNPLTPGTWITNTASVTSTQVVTPISGTVNDRVSGADLSLSKIVDNPTPNVGDTIAFTITIVNSGPDDATQVKASDPLPTVLTNTVSNPSQGSYNNTTGLWNVGTITNGYAVTLTLVTTVAGPSLITNTAQITTADQFDPNSTPGNDIKGEDDQDSIALSSCGSPPYVLFVVADPLGLNTSDTAIKSHLESLGYTVTVVDDNAVGASDADDKILVMVSSTSWSPEITTTFRDVSVPFITWEPAMYDDMGMTGPTYDTDCGVVSGQSEIDIVNSMHPMAAGLSGTVQVVITPSDMTWGRPNTNAITIATLTGVITEVIFGYDTGVAMTGLVAPARRVGLFLNDNTAADFTEDGWALFDAAVFWATSGSGCGRPSLQVGKSAAGADPLSPGDTLTYTIVIGNDGNANATSATLSDTVPSDTTFVPDSITLVPSSAGITGTTPPTLAHSLTITVGERVTVTYVVTIAAPLAGEAIITNTASITSPQLFTPTTDMVTATVYNPVLTLTKQSDGNWTKRIKLTFTNTAQTTDDLVNFPVLVMLNSSRINYGQTLTDGQDIRFVDADGITLLSHEIEKWDESGNSYVWVRVPQIDKGSNTDHIWMYYGNPDAPDAQVPADVWDATYEGVWHLKETVVDGQTSGTHSDSTSNNNNGVQSRNNDATGKIAGGQQFDGDNDYIQITGLLRTPPDITLSAWANSIASDMSGSELVSLGDHVAVRLDDPTEDTKGFFYDASVANWPPTSYPQNYAGAGWHYFVYTFDDAGNSQKLYIDGVERGSTSHASSIAYTGLGSNTFIGKHGDGSSDFDFNGIIDEVRVANAVRSSDWVTAQYKSMTDNFIAYGNEENAPVSSGSAIVGAPFTYTITITNTGIVTATAVVVTDTLPTGANYVSGGSLVSGDTVSWTINTLPANDSTQLTFAVTTCKAAITNTAYRVVTSTQGVDTSSGPGLLTLLTPPSLDAQFSYNPPTIAMGSAVYFTSTSTTNGGPIVAWSWDFGDGGTDSSQTVAHVYSNPGTYTATLTVTDTCNYTDTATGTLSVYAPVLTLAKKADPATITAGERLTYTIVVTNGGQGYVSGVIVTDTLPTNTSFITATLPHTGPVSGVITWPLGTLDSGVTRSITMVVRVDSSVISGTIITNTAAITGAEVLAPTTDVVTTTVTLSRVSFGSATYSVDEGDGSAIITVTLSTGFVLTATVDYVTSDGTATAGSDYTAISGTLTFAPGITSLTFTVPITDDRIYESPETISLTLSNPVSATLGTFSAILTILDNDTAGVFINPTSIAVIEGGDASAYWVVLNSEPTDTVTVTFSTGVQIDPIAPITFTTLNWNSSQTVTVSAADDLMDEASPHFSTITHLASSNDPNYNGIAPIADVIVSITDNDPEPTISIADVTVTEGDVGTVGAVFTLTLSAASGKTITVEYVTADGSATAGDDYTAVATQTLTFAPGTTARFITVTVLGDILYDPDETFLVNLTNPVNAAISDNQGQCTITDDDSPSFVSIYGVVFLDTNGSGAQNPGESGISGVLITLDAGSLAGLTTTTDLDGNYTFTTTATGVHTVVEMDPTISTRTSRVAGLVLMDEPDYFSTTPNEVHVDVTMGSSYQVNFGDAKTNDFASIHGIVFEDIDGDGVQGATELGLSDVLITLSAASTTALTTPITTTTDLNGSYTFSATVPGAHIVTATEPNNYFFTTPDEMHVDVVLGNAYHVDFGNAPTSSGFAAIYGTVFNDNNGNEIRDRHEMGIPDVIITLDGDASVTTDPYGGYTFSTTVASIHTLLETDLNGYSSTTPNEMTVGVTLGNGYQIDFGDLDTKMGTCAPDRYEEDDTADQATEFVVGGNQAHRFCDDATDWVKFTAGVSIVYTITTSSSGQRADTILALFDTDDQTQTLAYNDDYEGTTDGSSRIVWEAPANGDYYVRITNQNALIGQHTDYVLWIESEHSSVIHLPVVMRNS